MENKQIDQDNNKGLGSRILDFFSDMGSLFSKPRDPCDPLLAESSFSPGEAESIKKIFFHLDGLLLPNIERAKLTSKFKLRGIFGSEQLQEMFGIHLAPCMYKWFLFNKKVIEKGTELTRRLNKKNISPRLSKYPAVIDLNTFLLSMESLLRSFGFKIWLKNYSGLNALEMFIIIFFGQGRSEWLRRQINVSETRAILELLFSLVTPHSDNRSASQVLTLEDLQRMNLPLEEQKQEEKSHLLDQQSQAEFGKPIVQIPDLHVDSFIRLVFEQQFDESSDLNDEVRVDISQLFFNIKQSLPRLNNAIVSYFESRTILHKNYSPNPTLYSPPIAPHLPAGLKSKLLNPGSLAMLYLSIARTKSITMTRLYSSEQNGFSFNRLAYHWVGYNAATIMVCEARDAQTGQKFIIGAYCDEEMKDKARFHGNVNNCLFCLDPVFRIQRASSSGTNYQYLNTRNIQKSVYAKGLGFGGQYSDHKFWIDGEDMENNSFIKGKDDTYEIGHLANHSKPIVVKRMEIWGLGGRENLAYQEHYRALEKSRKEKDRKVDKQAFLDSDFDKQFLLGNTFSHAKEKEERN